MKQSAEDAGGIVNSEHNSELVRPDTFSEDQTTELRSRLSLPSALNISINNEENVELPEGKNIYIASSGLNNNLRLY